MDLQSELRRLQQRLVAKGFPRGDIYVSVRPDRLAAAIERDRENPRIWFHSTIYPDLAALLSGLAAGIDGLPDPEEEERVLLATLGLRRDGDCLVGL